MSLLDRHECPTCFKLTGCAGDRARSNPLRAHTACTCALEAGLTVQQLTGEWTEVLPDPLKHLEPRKAA